MQAKNDPAAPAAPENLLDDHIRGVVNSFNGDHNDGFVLSLLNESGESVRTIEVGQKRDDRTPDAHLRKHMLRTTDSLIKFIEKYQTEHTTIFVGDVFIEAVLNDAIDIGDREGVSVHNEPHRVYRIWAGLINRTVKQKDLLDALRRSESHLDAADLSLIAHCAKLGYSAKTDVTSVDDNNEAGYSILVSANGNEKMATLPKFFTLRIPVWSQDDENQAYTVKVHLRPFVPQSGQGEFGIELWSEDFDGLMDKRLEQERTFIAEALKDTQCLVLAGSPHYDTPRIGLFNTSGEPF